MNNNKKYIPVVIATVCSILLVTIKYTISVCATSFAIPLNSMGQSFSMGNYSDILWLSTLLGGGVDNSTSNKLLSEDEYLAQYPNGNYETYCQIYEMRLTEDYDLFLHQNGFDDYQVNVTTVKVTAPTIKQLEQLGISASDFNEKVSHGWTLYQDSTSLYTTLYWVNDNNIVDETTAKTLVSDDFGLLGKYRAEMLTNNYSSSVVPSSPLFPSSSLPLNKWIYHNNNIDYFYINALSCDPSVKFGAFKSSNGMVGFCAVSSVQGATFTYYSLGSSNVMTLDRYDNDTGLYYSYDNLSEDYIINLGTVYPNYQAIINAYDIQSTGDSSVILVGENDDVITYPGVLDDVVSYPQVQDLVDTLTGILNGIALDNENNKVITNDIAQSIALALENTQAISSDVPIDYDGEIPGVVFDNFRMLLDLPNYIFSSIFQPVFDIFQENSVYTVFLFMPLIFILVLIVRFVMR